MIHLFYTTYISVDFAHFEIVPAKVGKGGIKVHNQKLFFQTKHTLWVLKTNLNDTACLSTLNTF